MQVHKLEAHYFFMNATSVRNFHVEIKFAFPEDFVAKIFRLAWYDHKTQSNPVHLCDFICV